MSATPIWTVHCHASGPDRSDQCVWWIGQERSQADANAIARKAVWEVGRRYSDPNYCPPCIRRREEGTP